MPRVGIDALGRLVVTYIRRKASTAFLPSVGYAVEFNSAPETNPWAENPLATESATGISATLERVVVTDSAAASPRRLARVRVTALP
jgi:hypothetical protein